MSSIWEKTTTPPRFDPLQGDTKINTLIIGGGIAGILCAYRLKQAGVDCLLVEADRICHGITKDTTAKITIQHGLIYHTLIRRFGMETAQAYLIANQNALKDYSIIGNTIDCDFEECDSFVYSTNNRHILEQELDALTRLGASAQLIERIPLPLSTKGAVRVNKQAMFHPLKFLYAIAKNLPIAEQTKVLELEPGEAITNRGRIRADKIIVATHFPLLNKHGAYFIKLYQHRSYVLALENAPTITGMYVDESQTGLSFRRMKQLLLLGGGGHRTGKKGGCWHELAAFTKENYPNAHEIGRWATQDCMTLDGMPYIGPYSRHTDKLYVATGFNKWGMTSAMAAASILTDQILGKENPYAPYFSPARSILHPQLAVNMGHSLIGMLTPTAPRCPHLGCALKYNHAEHSWDCACHGSRFTDTGKLIDNPATDDKHLSASMRTSATKKSLHPRNTHKN